MSQDGDELLSVRLGYAPDAKLVILSCDDLGASHAANVGVYRALRAGAATCTSLMVPAPWLCHAAAEYRPTTTSASPRSTPGTADRRTDPCAVATVGEGGFPVGLD